MNIREYSFPEDFVSVEKLWNRCLATSYPMQRTILLPRLGARVSFENGASFCALENNTIIGFILADTDPRNAQNTGYVSCILVDPLYQRKGIGTELLRSAEHKLIRMG